MRTSVVDRRLFTVLIAILLWINILPDSNLMADSPTFSISNSFERDMTYIPGDWDTVDKYNQDYSLGWSETFSPRLSVDLNFGIKLEDVINSLGVDTKNLTLSTDGDLKSLIWVLSYDVEDQIVYTNEFNTPRRDEIQYGVDFNFDPYLLPPLDLKLQNTWDNQDFLEDKTDRKFEANTDYGIGNSMDLSLAWKQTKVDDRLNDNSDSDEHQWDTGFTYSRAFMPTLKFDYKLDYTGSRQETLSNAGVVLSTERAKELAHKVKISNDAFPGVSSSFEWTSEKDIVLDELNRTMDLNISTDQQLFNLGTLTEEITYNISDVEGSQVGTRENETTLTLELNGAPQKYTDYSIKYGLTLSDVTDDLDPANNSDTQEDTIDISLTLVPNVNITLDSAYNWSSSKTNGVVSGTTRTLKFSGTIEGEMLNIPNLTFQPKFEVGLDEDKVAGTRSDSTDIGLDLLYVPYLGSAITWELDTNYSWGKADIVTETLDLSSKITVTIPNISWYLNFGEDSKTTFDLEGNEPNVWQHEIDLVVGTDLTSTIILDADYSYQFLEVERNNDELSINLDWNFLKSFLTLSYSQNRVFDGPKDLTRTYTAEFNMDF